MMSEQDMIIEGRKIFHEEIMEDPAFDRAVDELLDFSGRKFVDSEEKERECDEIKRRLIRDIKYCNPVGGGRVTLAKGESWLSCNSDEFLADPYYSNSTIEFNLPKLDEGTPEQREAAMKFRSYLLMMHCAVSKLVLLMQENRDALEFRWPGQR